MYVMTAPKVPGSPGHKRVLHPDDETFWKQVNELALHLADKYGVTGFRGVEPKSRPSGNAQWIWYDTGYLYLVFRYKAESRCGGQWNEKPCRFDTVLTWMCEGIADFFAGKDKGNRDRLLMLMKQECGLVSLSTETPATPPNELPGTVITTHYIADGVHLEVAAGRKDYTLSVVQDREGIRMGIPMGTYAEQHVAKRAASEFQGWVLKYGGTLVNS
jgi:hypothetical protein